MKNFIAIAVLFLSALVCSAQDLITMKDGQAIPAKVKKVDLDVVEFIKTENPDGPIYTVAKDDILIITYANGTTDVFSNEAENYASAESGEPSYRSLKNSYNYKLYQPTPLDTYSRSWAGVASAVIPGLGQGLDDEWGRAIPFFLMYSVAGTAMANSIVCEYAVGVQSLIFAGCVALNVWSAIDAVRVAKVKNMYLQDQRKGKAPVNMNIRPYISKDQNVGGTAAGLTVDVVF